MDLHPYPTEIITTLSDSDAAMGGHSSIVLIISCHIFFFSKKMACSSSVSTFITKALNSIIKSAIFCFPYLKVLIFHLVSAAFILLLNIVLISLMNSS